ncbi:MAG: malic enzyme-like NAD(P)-binding protein [Kiritimatiellia bacterium]|jgi:malate dehydrogenase (oxaloacetate-decarboxylating)(NADP+)|nr:malic enzyme-like NAD(P)-binding protein [Kiritimatiellia bacterium]MDP6811146.1 malic enzyme-like NAD(P)-binding protein [Kiritimatiellia bacterium]MDP7023419.1 malic enzyme-like NAD(P)-binding protein [Kiritimatiellia bacterium]
MELTREAIFEYHLGGKVGMQATKPLGSQRDLSLAYTPGVAEAVRAIAADRGALFRYTAKSNLVAVVSDGSAILGLGDLGAEASIPVMEGKGVLFKAFGDVDGWPVPLNGCRIDGKNTGPTDPQRVIDMVAALAPMYGGINLEDIAAPACFEIEDRLDAMLDIPVFHDDQWGTAVITLAGMLNYVRLCEREMGDLRIVINGAGAAGIRIAEMLKAAGAEDVVLCDSRGTVRTDRADLNVKKREHAVDTSATTLSEAMKGAHAFIGVSVADCVSAQEVRDMADYPAIFAMANPVPEIRPGVVADVLGDSAYVMATGRSDYANQINNVLGFPFLFRGALDAGASSITLGMKVAAAEALAALAREPMTADVQAIYEHEGTLEFSNGYVIPKPFDRRLLVDIPFAVAQAAAEEGVASSDFAVDTYRASLEKRSRTVRGA